MNFGTVEESQIDIFGDAYEFSSLIMPQMRVNLEANFFTPQNVSKLIAQIAMHKQTSVNKIYDPATGSGSLLLQSKKHFDSHLIQDGFFGQEINHTTYNLARMNMFLHNINYDKFNIALGDTLINPHFMDEKPFDAIVSNPPYSIKWIGSDDPNLLNDERYAPAGVLAPKVMQTMGLFYILLVIFPIKDGLQLFVILVFSTEQVLNGKFGSIWLIAMLLKLLYHYQKICFMVQPSP